MRRGSQTCGRPRGAPAAAARLSTAVRATTASGQAAADALNAPLSVTDPELFDIIEHEKLRQARA